MGERAGCFKSVRRRKMLPLFDPVAVSCGADLAAVSAELFDGSCDNDMA
jgi:hypothetical protein